MKFFVFCLLVAFFVTYTIAENNKSKGKGKKKDITDYSDADVERLFDQWEENDDEELPEDEKPAYLRKQPKIDMSKFDPADPEGMLKLSKKGKTVMMFVQVSENPSERETEQVTSLWQSQLFNANYEVNRFVVDSNRVIFLLNDGSKAWEIKDFITKQDRCEEVTIEGKSYPGKASKKPKTEL